MAKKDVSDNPHMARYEQKIAEMRLMLAAVSELRNAIKTVASAACPFADNVLGGVDAAIAQAKELLGE